MYYIKDIGYIIKRVNISEADRYVTILTQNNGKIDVLAKGVRKLSSKRAGQLELLTKISFQAIAKNQNGRFILADTKLLKSHTKLKDTLESFKMLFTMCELISVLCPAYQKHEDVFTLVDHTLDNMSGSSYTFLIQSFQVKLLSMLGYWNPAHAFVDFDDVTHFTELVMERRLKSSEYFRT